MAEWYTLKPLKSFAKLEEGIALLIKNVNVNAYLQNKNEINPDF